MHALRPPPPPRQHFAQRIVATSKSEILLTETVHLDPSVPLTFPFFEVLHMFENVASFPLECNLPTHTPQTRTAKVGE
jgi:hypothetical protein